MTHRRRYIPHPRHYDSPDDFYAALAARDRNDEPDEPEPREWTQADQDRADGETYDRIRK